MHALQRIDLRRLEVRIVTEIIIDAGGAGQLGRRKGLAALLRAILQKLREWIDMFG